MTAILTVNHSHSKVCGIHDLGQRLWARIGGAYVEANDFGSYMAAVEQARPDMVIVNYRADLTPWWRPHGVPAFAIAHQYDAATIDRCAAGLLAAGFDYVLALDPDLQPGNARVLPVGRPIPAAVPRVEYTPRGDWHIGSFGFAFPHKGFVQVAVEVAEQAPGATYRLHMPEAFFNGANGAPLYSPGILDAIAAQAPGVHVDYTADHLGERSLVADLSANHVNCLFYVPGQPDAGLSSATDYLVAARRPMLLSDASMFRHIAAPRWPFTRLGDVLAEYDAYLAAADALYESMAARLPADIATIVRNLL